MSGRTGIAFGCAALMWLADIAVPVFGEAQTLTGTMAAAYSQNPKLNAARSELAATRQKKQEALAEALPHLSFDASDGQVQQTTHVSAADASNGASNLALNNLPTSTYGLTANQALFHGGEIFARYGQAKALITSETYRLASIEAQVIGKAADDFADLLLAQNEFALADDNIAVLKSEVSQTTGRYKAGTATRADLAQSQAALAGAQADRAVAQADLFRARSAFQRDTSLEPTTIGGPLMLNLRLSQSRDDAVSESQGNSPDVLAALFSAKAADQEVAIARSERYPQVNLQGVVEHQEGVNLKGESDDLTGVFIQLHVPIFSGGGVNAEVRSARALADQAYQQVQAARMDASYAARTAWDGREAAQEAIAAYRQEVEVNETALQGVRLGLETGERTEQDVLVAQHLLFTSRQKLEGALHDEFVARLALAAATGHLNGLDLGLNAVVAR